MTPWWRMRSSEKDMFWAEVRQSQLAVGGGGAFELRRVTGPSLLLSLPCIVLHWHHPPLTPPNTVIGFLKCSGTVSPVIQRTPPSRWHKSLLVVFQQVDPREKVSPTYSRFSPWNLTFIFLSCLSDNLPFVLSGRWSVGERKSDTIFWGGSGCWANILLSQSWSWCSFFSSKLFLTRPSSFLPSSIGFPPPLNVHWMFIITVSCSMLSLNVLSTFSHRPLSLLARLSCPSSSSFMHNRLNIDRKITCS